MEHRFYDYNTFDQNALLGYHPSCSNMVFATGFSGHGMQQAPAVGRGISELILSTKYSTIDLQRLNAERYLNDEPVIEKNVV